MTRTITLKSVVIEVTIDLDDVKCVCEVEPKCTPDGEDAPGVMLWEVTGIPFTKIQAEQILEQVELALIAAYRERIAEEVERGE